MLAVVALSLQTGMALAADPNPSPTHKGGIGIPGPALPPSAPTVGSIRRPVLPPDTTTIGRGPEATSASAASVAPRLAAPTGIASAWTELGPKPITKNGTYGNVSGRVDALAIDPTNPNVIFAGTAGGGVWKSADGGVNWAPMTDSQPSLVISALAIHPTTTPREIYAGTGDLDGGTMFGNGVLKSIDGGSTWVQLGAATFTGLSIGSIAIDRNTSGGTEHVFAATNGGLYFSTNGGATWTQNTQINTVIVGAPTVSGGLYQIIQDPTILTKFWATAADGCASEIGQVLVSVDSGTTWAVSNNFPLLLNAASRVQIGVGTGGVVYAVSAKCAVDGSGLYDIEKTIDGGTTWNQIPSTNSGYTDYLSSPAGGQGKYDNYVAVDPTSNSRVVFGGIDVLATSNGGTSFTNIGKVYTTGVVHPDQHAIAFLAASSFLIGNDGGVYKTTNFGGTGAPSDWTNLNTGLNVTQFYGGSSLDLTHMLGGTQDNASPGTFAGVAGNPTLPAWIDYGSGDGGYTAIDPTPGSKTIYTSYVFGLTFKGDRTLPQAETVASPCDGNSATAACHDAVAFIAPYLMDPVDPQHLLLATDKVYQSTSGGLPAGTGGWPKVSPVLTTGKLGEWISAMTMNPGGSVIVTGSVTGAAWRTVDGGTTWTNITGNLPMFTSASFFRPWISGIVANPTNPNELWVTIGRSGVGHVWHTTNANAGAGTAWFDLSGAGLTALPNFPTLALAIDPLSSATVYVGTSSGAYVCTTCGGGTPAPAWVPLGTGLPNVIIKQLTFTPDGASLIAWTYGRGAWAMPIGSVPPLRAVLPATMNQAYGGFTTSAYIENLGSAPAHVVVHYFDAAGSLVGIGDNNASLPTHASWTLRQDNTDSFSAGGAGSALVFSDQPLAAFVNEFAPGGNDASSYTSIPMPSGAAATIYAPAIANNAYGGYTTGIGLVNLGTTTANITVTYRDATGIMIKTQAVNGVAPSAFRGLYSGDATLALPSGFAGTATISSDALQPLAAVVNETGPGGQFSSYDALAGGGTSLVAPVALRNAFGGYNTGFGIQNLSSTAGTVNVTYYNSTGVPTTTNSSIAANGYVGIYQGTDIPSDGAYTATISTPTAGVSLGAIVNEVAPPGCCGAQQSTAYNTVTAGAASSNLALVTNASADGWSTGLGIMNTGAMTTVTVSYFNAATGSPIGTPQVQSLAPNAFWGVYQPSAGLPVAGTRASALVTTSAGGQVAVICNESGATSFMSYGGQ